MAEPRRTPSQRSAFRSQRLVIGGRNKRASSPSSASVSQSIDFIRAIRDICGRAVWASFRPSGEVHPQLR